MKVYKYTQFDRSDEQFGKVSQTIFIFIEWIVINNAVVIFL